jgi:hypothetical protein
MGMASWYRQESAVCLQSTRQLDTSVIVSTQQHIEDIHHTPLDKLEIRITSVEMKDDSLIFGRSQAVVTALHEEQEQFQYCYGAVTAIGPDKACLYKINRVGEDNLGTTTMRRVKIIQQDLLGNWETMWEDMEIPIKTQLNFLKVNIDNQTEMFNIRKNEISLFSLPTAPRKLPITAVRRIITQLLTPKTSQKLQPQPISQQQADKLDQLISSKIHGYYNWLSKVPVDILMLTVENHGFEFPSVADINAAIAIKGIHRDLNH